LDGVDCHVASSLSAASGTVRLGAVELLALLRQQLFVHRDLWAWLDDPFQPPPPPPEQQLELALT